MYVQSVPAGSGRPLRVSAHHRTALPERCRKATMSLNSWISLFLPRPSSYLELPFPEECRKARKSLNSWIPFFLPRPSSYLEQPFPEECRKAGMSLNSWIPFSFFPLFIIFIIFLFLFFKSVFTSGTTFAGRVPESEARNAAREIGLNYEERRKERKHGPFKCFVTSY